MTISRRSTLCVRCCALLLVTGLFACGDEEAGPSQSGPWLIYQEVGDVGRVVKVAADGSHRTVLWEGSNDFYGPPSVAVDGRVVFPTAQGWLVLPARGGMATALPLMDASSAVRPRWAPDASTIAWFVVAPSGRFAIGLAAPAAASIQLLTPDSMDAYLLDWSPDGGQLVFMAQNINTNSYNLYTVSRDGTNLRKITDDSLYVASQPTWSHGGGRIAFLRGNVVTINPDGTDLRVVTSDGAGNGSVFTEAAYWSPDDRTFLSSSALLHQIFRINASTGATAPIGIPFPSGDPGSPDGKHVRYDGLLPPPGGMGDATPTVRVALADGTQGIQVSPDSVPSINAVWVPSVD